MTDELEEEVAEFLVESRENLDRFDRDLVTLEQDPTDRDTIGSIFRTIHTIKGTCGFLGFDKLESVSHVGENLLSKVREGILHVTPGIISALLATGDAVREMLEHIEQEKTEGNGDYSELIAVLAALQAPPATPEPLELHDDGSGEVQTLTSSTVPSLTQASPTVTSPTEAPAEGESSPDSELSSGPQAASASESSSTEAVAPASDVPARAAAAMPEDAQEASSGHSSTEAAADTAPASKIDKPSPVDSSIRVDVGLLDRLMNLVGELVLARNQMLQYIGGQADAGLSTTSQRLNLITTELQEGVMKTRMQPIGNIWGKFPRVVRDLSLACGKQVRLEMLGRETELDKTLIEAIKDPLTHLVRNAVDHGIESADARLAAGKPEEGCLTLRAYHEGGHVNIEIKDDGAGIDPERLRAKALARGLIRPDQAERFSDRDCLNLIFLPGFSTAEKITNVSGRGVGMDVVKTNIEKIGGAIDIASVVGTGTTFRIKIPLTLAIIPALIVTTSGDRYAIPQVSLLELMRLQGDEVHSAIETIDNVPVCRLRGELLPLVQLDRELGLSDGRDLRGCEAVNIVVLQADNRSFGLVVDTINDTEEIVVKPLGKQLNSNPVFAGATIMGDGRVALILDVLGVAQRADILSEARDRALRDAAALQRASGEQRETLLILATGERGRVAIPLSVVSRLEEFPLHALEEAGDREVVQYRERILPLIRLSNALGVLAHDHVSEVVQVVVYKAPSGDVGLIVDRILDIVDLAVHLEQATSKPGVIGSAVIDERVTDVIDIAAIVRSIDPSVFQDPHAGADMDFDEQHWLIGANG